MSGYKLPEGEPESRPARAAQSGAGARQRFAKCFAAVAKGAEPRREIVAPVVAVVLICVALVGAVALLNRPSSEDDYPTEQFSIERRATQPPTKKYQFFVERGALQSALRQFSDQTDLKGVMAQPHVTWTQMEQIVGPFAGTATADEAIKALLKDTGLSYGWMLGDSIYIFDPKVVEQDSQ